MSQRNRFSLTLPLILAGVLVPRAAAVSPQDSQAQDNQSVADAARQSRDQKKAAAKPAKVVTDDDLDRPLEPGLNVGAPPKLEDQPPSPTAVTAIENKEKAVEAKIEKEKKVNPEIGRLKEEILHVQQELDLVQREFALDQDAYYSKPDYAGDPGGKQKLDAEQAQITEKQQQLEELKQQLAAAEEAEKSENPASDENPKPASEDTGSAPAPADSSSNSNAPASAPPSP